MEHQQFNLYVWENVLCDYIDGIMFAYAENVGHARRLILEKFDFVDEDDLNLQPREINTAEGFAVWGGG